MSVVTVAMLRKRPDLIEEHQVLELLDLVERLQERLRKHKSVRGADCREVADELVGRYLKRYGGPDLGHTFDWNEQVLATEIARALRRATNDGALPKVPL